MFEIPHLILFIEYIVLGIYGYYAINKVSRQFQIAIFYCATIIIGDGVSLYFSFIGSASYMIILFLVFTYVSTFFWLSSYPLSTKKKMYRIFGYELFLIFWIFGYYSFKNGIWPTLVVLSLSIILIGLTLSGLMSLLHADVKGNVTRKSFFWFYGSNFGFYCFSIMLFSLRALERFNLKNNLHNDLIIYGNIILYLGLLNSVRLEIKNNQPL